MTRARLSVARGPLADRGRRLVRQDRVERRHLASPARPLIVEPTGAAALDDPVTLAGLARQRHRSRRPIVRSFVAVVALGAGVAAAVEIDRDGAASLLGAGWAAAAMWFVAAVISHPLRGRVARRARRVFGRSSWRLVEVVRLPGKGPAGSMVGVLDPQTGQLAASWIVEDSWRADWPPADVRAWAFLARDPAGRRAILGSPNRSVLASLLATIPLGTDGDPHGWAWSEAARRWDLGPPSSRSVAGRESLPDDLGPSPATAARESLDLTARHWAAAAVVAGVLAIVAAGFGYSGRQAQDREDRAVRRNGERVSALVQGVENPRGGKSGPTWVHVQLETGAYAGSVARVAVPSQPELRRGDAVTVAYRSDRPEDLVIVGVSARPDNQIVVVGAWAVALGLACRATRDRRNAGVAPPRIEASQARLAVVASPLGLTRLRLPGERSPARRLAGSPTARRRLYGWRRAPSAVLVAAALGVGGADGSWVLTGVVLGAAAVAAVVDAIWLPRQLADLEGDVRPEVDRRDRRRGGRRRRR